MGCGHFNPRPPCGGRPTERCCGGRHFIFQSTSSVWRTTFVPAKRSLNFGISIHVLRVEDDQSGLLRSAGRQISIHVLRVEDDVPTSPTAPPPRNFNPRPPCGGRRRRRPRPASGSYFNPRPPCGGRRHCSYSNRVTTYTFQSTSSVWRTTRSF